MYLNGKVFIVTKKLHHYAQCILDCSNFEDAVCYALAMSIQLTETKDGSWTCFSPRYEEHYHNLLGAYTETVDIYTQPTRLAERLTQNNVLTAFDPFLGLGYNSLTLMHAFQKLQQTNFPEARLRIIAFEMDPEILALRPSIFQNGQLSNLKSFLPLFEHNIYYQTQSDLLDHFSNAAWDPEKPIDLKIFVGDTRQLVQMIPDESVDFVYHDAFSPRKQPELWTTQLFKQYARLLKPDTGTVMTYSSAAGIRKALLEAGFYLYPLSLEARKPGTYATFQVDENLSQYTDMERHLMHGRSGIPYEDNETLTLSPLEITERREMAFQASTLLGSSAIHRQYGGKW